MSSDYSVLKNKKAIKEDKDKRYIPPLVLFGVKTKKVKLRQNIYRAVYREYNSIELSSLVSVVNGAFSMFSKRMYSDEVVQYPEKNSVLVELLKEE